PCIPDEWEGYEIRYRFGNTVYQLHIKNIKKDGTSRFVQNGQELADAFIGLVDDGLEHHIEVGL
ncbi:MAG TPA: hypothetical protein VF421_05515, partial [Niabella sp.]